MQAHREKGVEARTGTFGAVSLGDLHQGLWQRAAGIKATSSLHPRELEPPPAERAALISYSNPHLHRPAGAAASLGKG